MSAVRKTDIDLARLDLMDEIRTEVNKRLRKIRRDILNDLEPTALGEFERQVAAGTIPDVKVLVGRITKRIQIEG